MTEPMRLPKRQHSRTKTTTSDATDDSRDQSSRPRLARAPSRKKTESLTSDEATAAFVKRTLCGHKIRSGPGVDGVTGSTSLSTLDDLLPPLTSSNDIDLQLYALIAIILKDFVQTWYSKITPDQQFTDKVIQIIAHCTRGLEQRLRHVNLETLIFDEIPAVIDAHVTAYRTACGDPNRSMLGTDTHVLYHMIHPHPALSPVPSEAEKSSIIQQTENETLWRQLHVQAALSQLLPPEDLSNMCLKVLVTDILSELIIGNAICGKICEGWFIWEATTKLIEFARPTVLQDRFEEPEPTPSRLEQFGLLSNDKSGDPPSTQEPNTRPFDILFTILWHMMHYSTMLFLGLRACVVSFSESASLPVRADSMISPAFRAKDCSSNGPSVDNVLHETSSLHGFNRPFLGMSAWTCCSRFLSIDLRMPWLTAICEFLQWLLIYGPGRVGCTNSRLDRLISHHVSSMMLNPERLPSLLLMIRTNLFPNNSLGQGRVPPTEEEALEIKRRCASAIVDALPSPVRSRLFATQDCNVMQCEVEEMLDVVGDPYMNKHMMFALVDLVFSRLFPEIQEQSISALLYAE